MALNSIPLPYRVLSAVALLGAVGAGGYFQGRADGRAVIEAKYSKAEAKLREAVDANIDAAQANEAAAAEAARRTDTIFREIHREIPTIVDRPVYRNVCVDADGVRALDQAVAAANGRGATAGEFDGNAAGVRRGTGPG